MLLLLQTAPSNVGDSMLNIRDVVAIVVGLLYLGMHVYGFMQRGKESEARRTQTNRQHQLEMRLQAMEIRTDEWSAMKRLLQKIDKRTAILAERAGVRIDEDDS